MYGYLFDKLKMLLNPVEGEPSDEFTNYLKDLFIGIILNLSCNVENTNITKYMIKQELVSYLTTILTDE